MEHWQFLDGLCDNCRIDAELFNGWTVESRCERCPSPSGLRVLAAMPPAARGGPLSPFAQRRGLRRGLRLNGHPVDEGVHVWVAS